ncbi:PPE domain-containing protein, partial [Mycobacteroides abscessus]
MAGEVHADFGGLAGDASALQASAAPSASPTAVIGPGLDSVSMAMAVHVNALAQSLDAHLAAASAQRQDAAAVTTATVATFEAADAANSSQMLAVASGGSSAPLPGALPPPPPAAGIPTVPAGLGAVPPPSVGAVELGEAFSTAIHSGPGPASLQAAAATWRARSGVESQKADQVQQAGSSMRSDWIQGSGGNTAADAIDEHAKWSKEAVTHAAGIAKLADNYAQVYSDARARTPTPAEFADLHNKLAKAQALQAQYGPRYTPLVMEISQAIVDKQGEASGAASWFQQAMQSAATEVGKTLSAAPNIVKPGGTGNGPLSGDDKGKQAGHKPGTPDEPGAGFGGGSNTPLDGVDPSAANPLNSDAMSSVGQVAGTIMGSSMGALQSLGSAGGGNPASQLSSALPGLSGLGAPQMP